MQIKTTFLCAIITFTLTNAFSDEELYSRTEPLKEGSKYKNIEFLLSPNVTRKLDQIIVRKKDILVTIDTIHEIKTHKGLLESAGDYVGNGGDDIRQKTLHLFAQTLGSISDLFEKDGISSGLIRSLLSTNSLVVVNELQIQGGLLYQEILARPAVSSEGFIFIDKTLFSQYLRTGKDVRNLLILMMLHSQGVQASISDANIYYSYLPSLETSSLKPVSTPWCDLSQTQIKIKKSPVSFKKRGTQSQETLKKIALKSCQESGAYECRIKKVGFSGFQEHARNFAIALGYKYSTSKKSRSDLKRERCSLLQVCEQSYQLAPIGQVSSSDYRGLDKEISKSCF